MITQMSGGTVATRDALSVREPDGYTGWSADEKAEWLWTRLISATAHTARSLPPLVLPFRQAPLTEIGVVLKKDELAKALTRTSDLMEPGRPKLIHARGAVARVAFEADPESPFSGLLAPPPAGGAIGLLRVSQVARIVGDAAVTPALALKLLIDGTASADVLAMNHTVGQGRDFNPFTNPMTNDLSDTHDELRFAQRMMSFFFKRISRQPRRMVSRHLATHHRDASPVSEPLGPERLEFHATSSAKAIFTDRAGVDFRIVLGELEPGTTIYEIFGITGGQRTRVGSLQLATAFVSSDGGDRLFFRHVHDPADQKWPA